MRRLSHPAPLKVDPLLGPVPAGSSMPAPIISFDGGSDDQNAAVGAGRVNPPDNNGDVGPNHYVQWINLIITVFDKVTGLPVLGPVKGNSLFTGFGGVCETTNRGDPTVIFDQFTGRWVASQFDWNTGTQCVAVTTSGDPTGTWNRYSFSVSTGFNDYPKMGNWIDGYYLTFNDFTPGGASYVGVKVVAFDKAKMIAGVPAGMIEFAVSAPSGPGCTGAGDCYFSLQPAHAEGLTPPPAGSPEYFVMSFDDESWFNGTPNPTLDFYKIWQLHADFTTPANSTFTGPVTVDSPEFDANLCNYSACIPQQSPGELLDTLSQFTMYRAAYRNRSGVESLYVASSVKVDANNRAGVRWTEIQSPGAAAPTLYQTGTHAPPDGLSRWMGSINADKDGNIAIGYSVSSSTMMPSIRYAGRLAGDPLGTLPQAEAEMFAGTGVQTASANRWGDYSSMSIDESDDCTFWYTQGYTSVTGAFDFNTRIGSFKFPSCINGPAGTLNGTVTTTGSGIPIAGAHIQIGAAYSTTTGTNGTYSVLVPVGTYDVTASKFGYSSSTATGVVITDGATTTQDFQLTPSASITVDGFVTDGSGGNFPLYADVTVTSGGGTIDVFTNPSNGYYSFSALVGTPYTLTVHALIAGYNPATRNIVTGTVDQQENFALTVNQATCNAPGYFVQNIGTPITANFESGMPAGWTVVNTTINCGAGSFVLNPHYPDWQALSSIPEAGNNTGGSGMFGVANSDACGSTVQMDTTLTSPDIDLTTFTGGARVNFNSDYNDLCSASLGSAVTLDMWNGTAWVTLFNYCGNNRRGPRLESFVTTAGDGAVSKVRWHYKARWDWWWEVDNVSISASSCVFTNGGLIYGNVTDLNTGLAINGATVSLDTGQTTTTGPTPADANIGDGFYYMYAPTQTSAIGTRVMTVSKSNYGTLTRNVVPTPRGSIREDFALPAGRFAVSPSEMRKRLPIAGTGTSDLLLNNTGTLAATFTLLELNVAPPQARPNGPFDPQVLPYDPKTKLGYLASVARDARNLPPRQVNSGRIYPRTGEYVNSFPTNLTGPWGAGLDFATSGFWVSSLAALGGDDKDHEFTMGGVSTGNTVNTARGNVFAADMAFVPLTGKLWQVGVGGDDCIFEIDPVAHVLTGNTICPAFGTNNSERGLAYDSASGHFYAGTWNDQAIKEFSADGTIIRSVNVGLAVSGLAYNPATHHLFVQVNASPQKVTVLDASSPTLAVLGTIILQNSSGGNAFPDFSGAGLELDCAGNLWAVNQTDGKVYINSVGETGACSLDIPWLSEDPTTGTVPAGGSMTSTFTFNTAPTTPGCKEAQVLVANDTPYGIPVVVVALTTQFNDVPLGSFGDFFIHAIAGAGISYGCGAGNFCPADIVTRRLMSVWLLRGKFGRFYAPPPATGIFADVSPESFAADWVEDLYNRGITGGCASNPLRYCPEDAVTRGSMAVFLLRTKEGSAYTPPACQGLFSDMDCSNFFTPWAEELYRRGITGGCSSNPLKYCPAQPTPRSQMSIFEARTFGIPACKQ